MAKYLLIMEPIKSKLKPVDLKIRKDLFNLETEHPIRDLDTQFIVNLLEAELEKRDLPLQKRLKLQK